MRNNHINNEIEDSRRKNVSMSRATSEFEGLTVVATLLHHQLLLIPEVMQKAHPVGANAVALQDLQGLLPINSIIGLAEVTKNDMQCLLLNVCELL